MNRFGLNRLIALEALIFLLAITLLTVLLLDIELFSTGHLLFTGFVLIIYLLLRQMAVQASFARFFQKGTVLTRSSSARLELIDPEGKEARYSKTKEITTEAAELKEFTETGIWSQGPLENLEVSDNIRFRTRAINDRPNHLDLDIELVKPMRRHQIREIYMAWTMRDSFTNDTEFFTVSVSYPANKYTLRITFPEQRPVKNAWVEFTYMGKKTRLTERHIHVDSNHRELLFSMNQIFPGMKAIIMWEW